MKKIVRALFVLCLLVSSAMANERPIEHRIVKFYDDPNHPGWSAVELELQNKKNFQNEVVLFCQLKNANGYTWTGKASALSLKIGERRTVRIPSEGDSEYFNHPTSARCRAQLPNEGHYTFVD